MERTANLKTKRQTQKKTTVFRKKEQSYDKESNYNQSQLEDYSQVVTLPKQKK